MIDIHAHILPGMDDGARDLYETMEMLKMAAEYGVTEMIATPHCNIRGSYGNYYNEDYVQIFRKVEKALQESGLPIRLYPGAEVFVTDDLPKLITEGKVLTLNGSRYMLLEFYFDERPEYMDDMLEQIAALGVCPVIAHPERYFCVQRNLRLAEQWHKKGYVLQCNKGSFVGRFGERCAMTAYELLERRLVSVVASDAHGSYQRTPLLLDTYEELLDGFEADYLDLLFEENPRRILKGQPVIDI